MTPSSTDLIVLLTDVYLESRHSPKDAFHKLEVFLGRWFWEELANPDLVSDSKRTHGELLDLWKLHTCHSAHCGDPSGRQLDQYCIEHATGVHLAIFVDLYPDVFWHCLRASASLRTFFSRSMPSIYKRETTEANPYAQSVWRNCRLSGMMKRIARKELLIFDGASCEAFATLHHNRRHRQSDNVSARVSQDVVRSCIARRDPEFQSRLQTYEMEWGRLDWDEDYKKLFANDVCNELRRLV